MSDDNTWKLSAIEQTNRRLKAYEEQDIDASLKRLSELVAEYKREQRRGLKIWAMLAGVSLFFLFLTLLTSW